MTGRPDSPSTIAPTPDGYEWRAQRVPNWRTPVRHADRCWYGTCGEEPVAELRRDLWSPMAGRLVAHWRGRCEKHLPPFWIDDGALYRWALEPAELGTAFEALTATAGHAEPPPAALTPTTTTPTTPTPTTPTDEGDRWGPADPAVIVDDRRWWALPWIAAGAAVIVVLVVVGAVAGRASHAHPASKQATGATTEPSLVPTTQASAAAPATHAPATECGTLRTGAGVYLDCQVPPASRPYATFTDGQQINLAMGPNSILAGSGVGSTVTAIECEFDGVDPTSSDACDPNTAAPDFPYPVYADGSFDYMTDNSGQTVTVAALPGASNPSSPIVCGVGHPCVWWIGADYAYGFVTGPHVFSNPFVVVGAKAGPNGSSPPGVASTTTIPAAGGAGQPPAHRLGVP
jgi:hypothetical protein